MCSSLLIFTYYTDLLWRHSFCLHINLWENIFDKSFSLWYKTESHEQKNFLRSIQCNPHSISNNKYCKNRDWNTRNVENIYVKLWFLILLQIWWFLSKECIMLFSKSLTSWHKGNLWFNVITWKFVIFWSVKNNTPCRGSSSP